VLALQLPLEVLFLGRLGRAVLLNRDLLAWVFKELGEMPLDGATLRHKHRILLVALFLKTWVILRLVMHFVGKIRMIVFR
jgi:hypothetical protein